MKPAAWHRGVVLLIALLAGARGISAQDINRAWTRTYDGGGIDSAADIALGVAGDPYIVGTAAAPDSFSTLLVHYGTNGDFIFDKKIGYWQIGEPRLATDDSGNAIVQAFHYAGIPKGGFVMNVASSGDVIWLNNLGINAYPVGVQFADDRIYVVDNFDVSPWVPEWSIFYSGGQGICSNYFFRRFYGWNMKVPPAGDSAPAFRSSLS